MSFFLLYITFVKVFESKSEKSVDKKVLQRRKNESIRESILY